MSDRATLLALAERVEGLTGPCREIDAGITVALKIGITKGPRPEDFQSLRLVRKEDECAPGTYWLSTISGLSLRTAEPYTADVDAADKLVPVGWVPLGGWRLADNRWSANITGPDDAEVAAIAKTPALALTAAALRARAEVTP